MKLALATALTAALGLGAWGSLANAANPTAGLPDTVVQRHIGMTGNDCEKDLPSGPETFALGHGEKFYLIPCVMGAYQGTSRAYISKDNDKVISPVMVLAFDETTRAVVPSLDLGEASYDAKSKTLSTFAKGRGIGDCGQSSESLVLLDEYGIFTVKTTQIHAKVDCDGQMTPWPLVFKQ